MKNAADNPNRSLVRIFCLSLGGLLFVYTAIAIYTLMMRPDVGAAEFATSLGRSACGRALGGLFGWGWLAEPLEHQVSRMGETFEAGFAGLATRTKIRAIV